jgi:transposase
MEATGVYYENLAYYLFDSAYSLSVVLPNKAKRYMECSGLKSKNDRVDAKGLAQMGAEQNLALWKKPQEEFIALRNVTRQRQSFQETKTILKNQLDSLLSSANKSECVSNSLSEVIKTIDSQILLLDDEIESLIEKDSLLKKKKENICAIKGVSTTTFATIIAETFGFEQFNNVRQLISFAGYDIVENQSGKHTGRTKISKKGNSRIRRVLHMPAFVTVSHGDKIFVDLWNRVFERTRKKMKAYVAVQRKLLSIMFALWKNDTKYQMEPLVMQS